jgi:dynamin 1-like protein
VYSCSVVAEAIRREIEEETIRHLSKVRKPVSPDPIQLAIYSPKVPNLTMVDMPGVLQVHACAGSQPETPLLCTPSAAVTSEALL